MVLVVVFFFHISIISDTKGYMLILEYTFKYDTGGSITKRFFKKKAPLITAWVKKSHNFPILVLKLMLKVKDVF